MASTDIDYQPPQGKRSGLGGFVGGASEYLWNPQKKECMGRTCSSWAKITIFYVIYYACLAGFWAAALQLLFLTMNEVSPNLTGYDSLLKKNPGKIAAFYIVFYLCLAGMWSGFLALFWMTVDDNHPKLQQLDSFIKSNPGKITLFYVIYYICLGCFWAAMWYIFRHQLDDNRPTQQGLNSLIKYNPGMGFRPMPNIDSTLIRFEQGKPSSYKVYTDHIQAYLDQYENEQQVGENFMSCEQGKTDEEKEKVCRFDVDMLGSECTWQKDYGYDEGKPCVLLKLNKIFGWMPELFTNDTKPSLIGNRFSDSHIGVTCEGENPADKENLGRVVYYPHFGFPTYYYPYLNQDGYRAPLMFVSFPEPKNGVLIQVWCKAWAKNIYHHKNDKAGSVHFELLVD